MIHQNEENKETRVTFDDQAYTIKYNIFEDDKIKSIMILSISPNPYSWTRMCTEPDIIFERIKKALYKKENLNF